MAQRTQASQTANRPEKKFGPYVGGMGVAIWLNTIETEKGTRRIRSISVAPRRYRDAKTGEWKDASSYRPIDLPALIFSLTQAHEYCLTEPVPDEEEREEE